MPASKSLGARSISAVFWGAGGAALRMLLQIGAQITLARLLGPDQYGVFAIGATVIGFSAFFSDVGLAYGLIQKAQLDELDVRFVVTWQIVLGLLVAGVVWLAAVPIAGFFGEPRSASVLRALSALCLLNALAAPALNLLKRKIDFKRINIFALVSYAVGYLLVGVPMALAGAAVWALVAAWLLQALVNLALLYNASRHALKPLFWYPQARGQSRYGATVFFTNLINWLINNVDRIVVGRVFGSHEIGLYATAYNLLYTPAAAALGVVQPVFFSASSRLQDAAGRIASGYRALLGGVMLVALPLFTLVAVATEAFIGMLYGPQWAGAAALCRPIALAMPFFLVWGFTTPLLWTGGKPGREFLVQLPLALAWCGACLLAARYSVEAVAWSVLALAALRCLLIMVAAARVVHMPWVGLWAALRGGLLISVAIGGVLAVALPRLAGFAPALQFGLLAMLATIIWWLMLRAWPGLVASDLRQLLGKLALQLPMPLKTALAILLPGGIRA